MVMTDTRMMFRAFFFIDGKIHNICDTLSHVQEWDMVKLTKGNTSGGTSGQVG